MKSKKGNAVTASVTYPSLSDFARFIGSTPSTVQQAIEQGRTIKGYKVQYSRVLIRGCHLGEGYDFVSLHEAAKVSGIPKPKLLSLIETGEEYNGWTFDEL